MKIITGPTHDPAVLSRLGFDTCGSTESSNANLSQNQEQTMDAFAFKWARRDSYESEELKKRTQDWMVEKYCAGDRSVLDGWLQGGRKVILDAGCGSGYSTLLFFGDLLKEHDYVGVDISDSIDVAAQRFNEEGIDNYIFAKSSITDLPLAPGSCDLIYSEGVLHHTDNTRESMLHLARALAPDGRLLFYIYKKKSVIREFTDDHIRDAIQEMDDETSWEALKPLTRLGIALGELDAVVDVPEEIPFLGIPAGKISVQRLFYWHVMKMYHSPELDFEAMHHINFDWFRPLNCHRHTPEQVQGWCKEAGLKIERMDVSDSGITTVARRA